MEYRPILQKNNVMRLPKRSVRKPKKLEFGKLVDVAKKQTCLNGYYKQLIFSVKNGSDISIENYLKNVEHHIIKSLENNIGSKVILGLATNMRQENRTEEKYFNTYPHIINAWNNKKNIFNSLFSQLVNVYNNTDFEGSGWSLIGNVHVSLNYGKYQPFKGGCSIVELPKWLSDKKAITSIISGDQKCFYRCILRFFHPKQKDKGRVDKFLKMISIEDPNKYADFSDVEFPVCCNGIEKFQKKNPHIYILIYGVNNETQRTPLIYDGKEHINQNHTMIPMLYYCNRYYLVNDLSSFTILTN